MVNEMLLEHEAPSLDDVEKCLLEGLGIHTEPVIKQLDAFDGFCFLVDLLICVNLNTNNGTVLSHSRKEQTKSKMNKD